MEQRSPEWYAWRKNRIGASAAATIAGLNPYQTVIELWDEMMGLIEPKPINHHMQRGMELEDEARLWIEDIYDCKFPPECLTHPKHDWMIASFDGINHEIERIVEIKCPSPKVHDKILKKEIPEMYLCQMQHQMAVSGYDEVIFVSYTKENPYFFCIFRDDKFIEELIEKEYDFWLSMQKFKRPTYEVV